MTVTPDDFDWTVEPVDWLSLGTAIVQVAERLAVRELETAVSHGAGVSANWAAHLGAGHMIYGAHLSTAAMMVNQYRQDVLANNLANVDTVGFKHDLTVLSERPVETREDPATALHASAMFDRLTGGTLAAATWHTFSEGPTLETGEALDLRIDGPGFFQVQTAGGVRYTRDGRLALSTQGVLVTATGQAPVLSDDGQPIRALTDGQVTTDSSGAVLQDGRLLGRVGIVDFEDRNALRKVGGNLFKATAGASPQAFRGRVRSGALEGSTVNPVNGLAEMIQVSRAFEINANFLRLQDQTLGRLITDLARF